MKTYTEVLVDDLTFSPNRRSMIFENAEVDGMSNEELKVNEEAYKTLIEYIEQGKDLNELDEGVFGAIFGGLAGVTVGPWLGKAICKCLGIDKGLLYDVFTSRLFTTALGVTIGKR